jgi:hypothetical protein
MRKGFGVAQIERASAFAAVVLAASLVARPASAADERKKECIAASERAQRLRLDGKLSEARKELLTCGASDCPAAVRADCINWLAQVTDLMPTIVVIAHDERGEDVGDVKVFLDGEILAEKIDGKAIPVPTGEHVLRFERRGSQPIGKKILVHEGETARRVEVTFTPDNGAAPPPVATSAPPPQKTAPAESAPVEEKKSGGSVMPWVLVGVGGAALATGVVMFVVGNGNFPAGCNGGTCDNRFDGSHGTFPVPPTTGTPSSGTASKDTVNVSGKGYDASGNVVSCANSTADGCADSDYNRKRQQDAGSSSGFKSLGTIIAISGGVVLAGGLVWWLVQPSSKHEEKTGSSGRAFFYPIIGDKLTGGGLTATF